MESLLPFLAYESVAIEVFQPFSTLDFGRVEAVAAHPRQRFISDGTQRAVLCAQKGAIGVAGKGPEIENFRREKDERRKGQ